MITVEVILIIIGLILLVGSFMVKDKLSQKDIDTIAKMSDEELKVIAEKQLKHAENAIRTKIENTIESTIDESKEMTMRAMEKESNEKILAISEYSDTVLESMNKTHNEIMFLYSMLNDKHKDLSEFAGELQQLSDRIANFDIEETARRIEEAKNINENEVDENEAFVNFVAEQQVERPDIMNNNQRILVLHQSGMGDVEIAKKLGLGLGEVKLVIGLYKGETPDEI